MREALAGFRQAATGESGLLRRPHKYFTYKALRRLGDDHLDGMSYVLCLQQLTGILPCMRRKIGSHRPGADRADPNVVLPQILRHASPSGPANPTWRRSRCRPAEGVLAGQRGDVDDVPAAPLDHRRARRLCSSGTRISNWCLIPSPSCARWLHGWARSNRSRRYSRGFPRAQVLTGSGDKRLDLVRAK